LLILYLWVWPDVPELFQTVFCVVNGPLMWAVVVFRNSMVSYNECDTW